MDRLEELNRKIDALLLVPSGARADIIEGRKPSSYTDSEWQFLRNGMLDIRKSAIEVAGINIPAILGLGIVIGLRIRRRH